VTGEWSKLPNEDLHNLDTSLNIIRQIKLVGVPKFVLTLIETAHYDRN
jgi:hypothetical protein